MDLFDKKNQDQMTEIISRRQKKRERERGAIAAYVHGI
jgi:hypothetical protein